MLLADQQLQLLIMLLEILAQGNAEQDLVGLPFQRKIERLVLLALYL
jgi:hypothetical protein